MSSDGMDKLFFSCLAVVVLLCHSLISSYPRYLLPQVWLAKGQPIILWEVFLLFREGTVS